MRLTKLWTIPVTALLLTACSTETLTDSTTIPTGDDAVSFARLNVNLPSVPTTRTYTPDAGADDEFKVTGKTRIFLFENEKGATTPEDNYTYLYEAEPTDWISQFDNKASGDEYQGTESFIIKLRGANKSYSNLYALVVLNGDNILAPSANETFGAYNAAVSITNGDTSDYLGGTANGFFMANAANGNAASDKADPTVLVHLTPYNSPDAAETGPGNNIYVERNAVKVTVTKAQEAYTLKSDAKVKVTPLAWTLTNTNLKMYPFHKVTGLRTGGTNSYKDIWSTTASDGTTVSSRFLGKAFDGFRRTLWSMDPNYSTKAEDCAAEIHVATAKEVTEKFSTTTSTSATETAQAVYHPLYCAENTFDIAHMMKGQTTAVIVKAQLTGYSNETRMNEAQAAAKPRRFTRGNTSGVTDNCYGNNGHVWSEGYFAKLVADKAGKVFDIPTLTADNVVLDSLLGKVNDSLTAKNFTDLGADFKPTAAQLKELNIRIGPVTGYAGGICYYIAYIKHFGDDETPWQSGDDRYGSGVDANKTYLANKKYLGRYGVVRNNWYDLSIQDFAYPGSPDIPTPDPDAPDDDNSVIQLNVKVNPWAKEPTNFVPLE